MSQDKVSGATQVNVNGNFNLQKDTEAYQIGGISILSTPGGNVFVGQSAGTNNTGHNNTFVGLGAGYSNTTANSNAFFGGGAGNSNQTGFGNTFLGVAAGGQNLTGSNNVFSGTGAGTNNTTGSNNIFLGFSAGGLNKTGSNNITIGNKGSSGDANTIRIGTQGTQTATYIAGIYGNKNSNLSPVLIDQFGQLYQGLTVGNISGGCPSPGGYFLAKWLTSTSIQRSGITELLPGGDKGGFVGIGTASPSSLLDVNGNINTAATYGIGKNTVLSIGSLADDNLFVGVGAGASNVGGQNQGQYNTFSGFQAGYSNKTGYENTFYGQAAGYSNTTGHQNTFYGQSAGYSNTIAGNNTFFGYHAGLNTNIKGVGGGGLSNTFVGSEAGSSNNFGDRNTFLGDQAGRNSGADYNTFVGDEAGFTNTTGKENTFLGRNAGYNNNGNGNIYLGAYAGLYNTTGSKNIYLGNEGCPYPCLENSTIRIGTDDQTGKNGQNKTYIAGIANIINSQPPNVYVDQDGRLWQGTPSVGGGGNVSGTCSNGANYLTKWADKSTVECSQSFEDTNGNVGIGTTTPSVKLEVKGDTKIDNDATIDGLLYLTKVQPTGNTLPVCVSAYDSGFLGGCGPSSRRFKDQIADMGDHSSKLFQLRPVTFFYKPQYDDGSHLLQYGLIAEEVAKVYPEMVAYDKDGQPYTVKYQLLAPMLLNEVQKQQKVVTAQQQQIEQMQQRLSQLEAVISKLTQAEAKK
jgi:hypothetical protein